MPAGILKVELKGPDKRMNVAGQLIVITQLVSPAPYAGRTFANAIPGKSEPISVNPKSK